MNLRTFVVLAGIVFFGIENTYGQTEKEPQETESKTTLSEVPLKVKEALKSYSGYQISEQAILNQKSSGDKVFTFAIKKGAWTEYLIIHENGKILGLKSQEGER